MHRARFLDELIKLIPPSTALFNKSLAAILKNPETGVLTLKFVDGETATASAIIACDGIKSVARQQYVLAGVEDKSILRPAFANEFAYRGIFSLAQFTELTGGAIDAGKMSLFCGPDSYVVMYSVDKENSMNVVAIKQIPPSGSVADLSESNWVQPVSKEIMLADFDAWGSPVKALLSNISNPQRWMMHDHHAAPTCKRTHR